MIRINRLLWLLLSIILFSFISVSYLPYLYVNSTPKEVVESTSPTVGQQNINVHSPHHDDKKFFSWFPFGDFAEQQEAFRTALRLAVETKRTIIAPMIRLGKPIEWAPFEELARRYEAQDKIKLRRSCASKTSDWRTTAEPCETINEWTEIPWSLLYDFSALKSQHGVNIVGRESHGWGVSESALGGSVDPNDVAILDPLTYAENATDYQPESETSEKSSWFSFLQGQKVIQPNEKHFPLKGVVMRDTLMGLNEKRLIQFGALSSSPRFTTSSSKEQMALKRKEYFGIPHLLLKNTANDIVKTLGGADGFNALQLDLTALIALEPQNEEDAVGRPKQFHELSETTRNMLMNDVVREVFGDIPINQAVSVAMPIKPSELKSFLEKHPSPNMSPELRFQLLKKCINYRTSYEQRYPIYYVANDAIASPAERPDLFGPLFEFTPCIFSKVDMINWKVLRWERIVNAPELIDDGVDYKNLLAPILDVLVNSKAYSFFELPPTRLTRLIARQKSVK